MTLTIEKLMVAAQLVRDFECKTGSPLVPVPFHGLEVIFDPNALAATAERNFSPSKNRSKRVLKKLIKRYGSEFKMGDVQRGAAMTRLTPDRPYPNRGLRREDAAAWIGCKPATFDKLAAEGLMPRGKLVH
ncbi:hypothetical protein KXW36_000308, partial [Aspergillus fumigatus]